MNAVVLFSLFVLSAVVSAEERFYTSKYDHIDVDAILNNNRLLNNYIKCILDKGKCNDAGATLKKIIPDALATGCEKCSEKQVIFMRKVVTHLIKNRRADWDALTAKYDPEGNYRKNYNVEQLAASLS